MPSTTGREKAPSQLDLSGIAQLVRLLNRHEGYIKDIDLGDDQLKQVERFMKVPFLSLEPFPKPGSTTGAQVSFCEDPSRNKWALCGNRAGKSKIGVYEDQCDLLLLQPITLGPSKRFTEPVDMWVVSDTEETSRDIIQRTFVRDILGENTRGPMWDFVDDKCKYDKASGFSKNRLVMTNGSICGFKFSSQGSSAMQGVPKHKIHLDEEQPFDVYSECRARLVDYRGYMLGTMTPVYRPNRGISWVHQELFVPRHRKKVSFHSWSLLDNPYLSKEAKEELIEEWSEDEIELRVYGQFVPMGVRLAIPGDLIKEKKEGAYEPKQEGIVVWKDGRPVFEADQGGGRGRVKRDLQDAESALAHGSEWEGAVAATPY